MKSPSRKVVASFRRRVFKALRRDFEEVDPDAACVYLALLGEKLAPKGWGAVPVAGSLSWPRIRPEEDDGVVATHFSYIFEPEVAVGYLAAGMLPELHAWLRLDGVEGRPVLDIATMGLARQCRSTARMPWTAPAPPPFYLGEAEPRPGDPYGILYVENAVATAILRGELRLRTGIR